MFARSLARVAVPSTGRSYSYHLRASASRHFSITYSGGQATEGQGGYYGSGGARVISQDGVGVAKAQVGREQILAMAHDLEKIQLIMRECERLENELSTEQQQGESTVSAKSIEIRAGIKKIMTAPDALEALKNLEVNGEPTWGLSCDERTLITHAREKVDAC